MVQIASNETRRMIMSMLNFLKKKEKSSKDDHAISLADQLVSEVMAAPNTSTSGSPSRGRYKHYTPNQRYEIGKYAAEHGNANASKKFSAELDIKINESTVRGFKKKYYEQLKSLKKRKLEETDCDSVDNCEAEIRPKKRGRKLLLGDELDSLVQRYIVGVRESGGVINTQIVIAAARGIVLSRDRTMLRENGGSIDITRTWALSLMNRMSFVKRKGSTAKKVLHVENFESIKEKFLSEIQSKCDEHRIPAELVINWDQTGIHIVPVSQWTMHTEGAKRVEIAGIQDKRQITGKPVCVCVRVYVCTCV